MPLVEWLAVPSLITPDLVAHRQEAINLLFNSEPLFYRNESLARLLEQITSFAADLLDSRYALVYAVDADTQLIEIQHAIGLRGVLPTPSGGVLSMAERSQQRPDQLLSITNLRECSDLSHYPFGGRDLSVLSIPLQHSGDVWGVLQVARPSDEPYSRHDADLLALLAKRAEQSAQVIREKTDTPVRVEDPLTRFYTRDFFLEQLHRSIQKAKRTDEPVSLLMLDVDGFAEINQQHGYATGDRVLSRLAAIVRHTVRLEDILGRHYSDELLIGLPGTDRAGAQTAAQRIQAGIDQQWDELPSSESLPKPTVTVGVVSSPDDGTTTDALLQTASEMLAEQKQQRRLSEVLLRTTDIERLVGDFDIAILPRQTEEARWSLLDIDLMWLGMALVAGTVGSERASVMLMDSADQTLLLRMGKGLEPELMQQGIHQRVGDGIAGQVAATGEPLLLTDVIQAGYTSQRTDRYRTRSCLSIPIRNGHLTGILNLADKQSGMAFDDADLEFAMNVAEVVATPLGSRKTSHLAATADICRLLERRFPYLNGHSDQVAEHAVAIGRQLGLKERELARLRESAWIHDLGEFEVRPNVYPKVDQLEQADWSAIHQHPVVGHDLCNAVSFLRGYRHTIRQHHERPDGEGYPDGTPETAITTEAKILGVAEAFVGMRSSRLYRPALTIDQALAELTANAGTQYDSDSVHALVQMAGEQPTIPHD